MNSVRIWDRFPFRLFFVLFIPVALLILGGAWYVGHQRIEGELNLVQSNEVSKVVLGVRRLDGGMQVPLQQLGTLANADDVRRAIADDGTDADRSMEAAFLNLITYNKIYDQVRWIDENGLERVRVNNVAGHPTPVPKDQLQNQAGSYYFTKAVQLKPGEVYMSPLDLNVEHGQVEVPHKPVLRLATPVQDRNGRPRGILIVTIAAQHLLDGFTESVVENRDHVMLVNPQGYWLRSPNPKDDWGFMFGRKETLGSRYPGAWKSISTMPMGQIESDDGLWSWSTVYPLKVEDSRGMADVPYWLVISHLPSNYLTMLRDAAWKTVSISSLVLLSLSGFITAWLALAITGRKRAAIEAARAQAKAEAAKHVVEMQERFHLAIKGNVNGVLVVDISGHIVMVNPALERMFGYETGELTGQPLETLLPEPARLQHSRERTDYLRAPVARAMGTGRDLQGRRKDGSVFPVEISLSPFTDNGKQYVDAIVADISERKRSELLLKKSETRLQLLWQTSPNGLVVVDAKGRIEMTNPTLERMFGYEPGELLNQPVECLVPQAIRFSHTQQRMHYLQDPAVRSMGAGLNLQGERKNGSTFPIEVSLASFTEEGQVYTQATVVDMTGWKFHPGSVTARSQSVG
ncbi:MAG: PAS domain S-box protein [Thiobacillaceae bacterium]